MNIKSLLITICVVVLLSSCNTTYNYYQLYNVKPVDQSITKADALNFEDENCKISYNLWSEGGNMEFDFYNKTDQKIYVKLNESFFIKNGYAYDLFRNRTWTKSDNFTTSNGYYSTLQSSTYIGASEISVSTTEDSIVCIPPKTTKKIPSDYLIFDNVIRTCDLVLFPSRRKVKTVYFTEDKSPVVFSNRITYEINGAEREFENKFYVSGITNYPQDEFLQQTYDDFCGKRDFIPIIHYRYAAIDCFYIKYEKSERVYYEAIKYQ